MERDLVIKGEGKVKKRLLCLLAVLAILINCCSCSPAIDVNTEVVDDVKTDSDVLHEDRLAEAPDYTGELSTVVNNNRPYFNADDLTAESFEKYSDLDYLGRVGTAYANICKELMPTEERGSIGMVKPAGWHTVKYDWVDGKYLYNRCHLIAFCLAGENANEKNLTTGTRSFNLEMLKYEERVLNYVRSTSHHVLYRVTPVYTGENLLCDGVLMEAKSVEDDEIEFCVFVHNQESGVEIDHRTGESKADGTVKTIKKTDNTKKADYILNTNSKKIHKPECSSISDMKTKNAKKVHTSVDILESEGYTTCGNCFH